MDCVPARAACCVFRNCWRPPHRRIPVDKKIGDDMTRFLVAVAADTSIDPKTLELGKVAVAELVARIAQAYELEMPAQAAG